jgi:hypothetical protein
MLSESGRLEAFNYLATATRAEWVVVFFYPKVGVRSADATLAPWRCQLNANVRFWAEAV